MMQHDQQLQFHYEPDTLWVKATYCGESMGGYFYLSTPYIQENIAYHFVTVFEPLQLSIFTNAALMAENILQSQLFMYRVEQNGDQCPNK